MNFDVNKVYDYEEIARIVSEKVVAASYHLIGITGTSSVGKSTFTQMIKKELEKASYSVQILHTDDYLNNRYKAETRFWNRLDSTFLKPEFFDWCRLKDEVEELQLGKSVEHNCYVRGLGWGQNEIVHPADVILIEGLFMDSVQAAEEMEYDLLISLTATDELITELRIKRDAYYRANYKDFQRTESETLQEIENTLKAGKSYQICRNHWNTLFLDAKGNYNATVKEQ